MSDRDTGGRFALGNLARPNRRSGNGAGRTAAIQQMLAPHEVAIVQKLCALAQAGDPASMKLYLSYRLGAARTQGEHVTLPEFEQAPTLQDKAAAVLAAVADGRITIEAAEKLSRMVEIAQRATEGAVLADVLDRLDRLEGRRVDAIELA